VTRRAAAPTVVVQKASGASHLPSAAKIRAWAKLALAPSARGELTVRLVDEDESAALNSRYRGKAGPTNVLAFPSEAGHALVAPAPPPAPAGAAPGESTDPTPLGDVVICAAVVAREAREQGKPLEAHWAHMVLHGTLHLMGFDHETGRDAKAMERRERELLAGLGFDDPYSV
jgi:probable rRNA maturation factor